MEEIPASKERLVYVAKQQQRPNSTPTEILSPAPATIGPSSLAQGNIAPTSPITVTSSNIGISPSLVRTSPGSIIIDTSLQENVICSSQVPAPVVAPIIASSMGLDSITTTTTPGSCSGIASHTIALTPGRAPEVTINYQAEEVPSNQTFPSGRIGSSHSAEEDSSEDDITCGLDDRYASDPGIPVDDPQSENLPSKTDSTSSSSGTGSKDAEGYQRVLRSHRGIKKGINNQGIGINKSSHTLPRKGPSKSK